MIVTFTKKFAYASYLNLDLGGSKNTIPISAEGQCEDTKEAFFTEADRLNDWCNEWFKTRYGEFEEQRGTVQKIITVSEIEKEPEPKLTSVEYIIKDISTCTEKKVLESYRLIAKSNPDIKKAYDKKIKELK